MMINYVKNGNFYNSLTSDLQTLISYLIQNKNEVANNFYDNYISEEKKEKPNPIINKVFEIWHCLLPQRTLELENGKINVITMGKTHYSFMELSDGEKAIFYYIGHILTAKRDSFIIIDEPENHLHLAIISKLWDILEKERNDCRFIYLTHNLDFASSRINSEKLWMKGFEPPAKWDIQKLPENKDIPESIYMELLGSRKKILFCEGKKDSYDYKLYSILFPEYTIIPVDGHINVINYTKAFNKSENIHNNSAIGIIDGDFHSDTEKNAWKQEKIYVLDVQEIENLLCDELILNSAQKRFCGDIIKSKENFFDFFERSIENQALEYATQKVNYYFEHNLMQKARNKEELQKSFESTISNINIGEFYSKRKEELQNIIDRKDFTLGIKKCNSKGILPAIYIPIEKEYKSKLLTMIEEDEELQKQLIEKYFIEIEN